MLETKYVECIGFLLGTLFGMSIGFVLGFVYIVLPGKGF